MRLLNATLLERNVAPEASGSSIYLAGSSGTLEYTLPAPPGRWLNIRQGLTFELGPGAEDLDFPYACAAGVVGGTSPEEQLGPGCSRPCPAGRLCPPATTQPQPCTRGSYCPRGTPTAIPCPAGSYGDSDSLESEAGCQVCPVGFACSSGAVAPEPCAAGRYGSSPRQESRDCTGACERGHYCEEGSTTSTSGICRESA